jgi:signal transduction histidine kinase
MPKIEAGKFELSPVELIFGYLIQSAVTIIDFRVDKKQQTLTTHIDSAIPRALIAGSQRRAQVITNLLGNAAKFAPERSFLGLDAQLLGEENGSNLARTSRKG